MAFYNKNQNSAQQRDKSGGNKESTLEPVGGLYSSEGKNGQYFKCYIHINGKRHSFLAFKNNRKTSETSSDFVVYVDTTKQATDSSRTQERRPKNGYQNGGNTNGSKGAYPPKFKVSQQNQPPPADYGDRDSSYGEDDGDLPY